MLPFVVGRDENGEYPPKIYSDDEVGRCEKRVQEYASFLRDDVRQYFELMIRDRGTFSRLTVPSWYTKAYNHLKSEMHYIGKVNYLLEILRHTLPWWLKHEIGADVEFPEVGPNGLYIEEEQSFKNEITLFTMDICQYVHCSYKYEVEFKELFPSAYHVTMRVLESKIETHDDMELFKSLPSIIQGHLEDIIGKDQIYSEFVQHQLDFITEIQ
ncbi:hypothetical protein L3Y34_015888 [Caenorhabditis briggsae]|uniref:Uncharacterized protein n=1 Tax=Caenorhabditis briggsae TaxID=6238 RepID=A0AAE9IZX5_CAEBR|nr:hypothetical protein L3Y34_015888 [Caenorhabditis briggsae]